MVATRNPEGISDNSHLEPLIEILDIICVRTLYVANHYTKDSRSFVYLLYYRGPTVRRNIFSLQEKKQIFNVYKIQNSYFLLRNVLFN